MTLIRYLVDGTRARTNGVLRLWFVLRHLSFTGASALDLVSSSSNAVPVAGT